MAVDDDVKTLLALVTAVERTLEWLTRAGIRDVRFRSHGLEVWDTVSRHLTAVHTLIGSIRDERSETWIRLEAVGLTGVALSLKVFTVRQIVAPLRTSEAPSVANPIGHRTTPKGAMKRLLRWINSFLGSLGKALIKLADPIDFVKEYKESVELVVEHQRSVPPPPTKIFEGI